jgi:hypothetical protein
MSKIERYTWEWNNDLSSNLKIGNDFSEIKDNYYQDEVNKLNFLSKDPINFPENIEINENGKIKFIAFGKNYCKFIFSFELFDKNSIIKNLDKVLLRETNTLQQYKIQCVFRDFFLTRVHIYIA